jgi:hypothetical protein
MHSFAAAAKQPQQPGEFHEWPRNFPDRARSRPIGRRHWLRVMLCSFRRNFDYFTADSQEKKVAKIAVQLRNFVAQPPRLPGCMGRTNLVPKIAVQFRHLLARLWRRVGLKRM